MTEYQIERMKHEIAERMEALEFLRDNIGCFPEYMDKVVTGRLFRGWRFVKDLDNNEILFANCLQPAITKREFDLVVGDVY
ncbi:TPA: hypothetical protein ACSEXO_003453 [Proteus mirabilis]|uniref:Uncharacterized protein n=1 Tax=Proteus faecis TaxID=2050967 RepID=A0AAW7CP02_9GAMM|nr:hypothetical protein [Proteus faecis]MDL5165782.1 hypothetical protein [Proteus faecis]MDL5273954.1 hypothetical protein [Proteus faecis]MDL5277524.1 hypothetical protein [Proteus faecis]MDL5306513.1 hypothetical protein [Proteus faecis]MDL5310082.1 hypothetical protein [Proteus faecis]